MNALISRNKQGQETDDDKQDATDRALETMVDNLMLHAFAAESGYFDCMAEADVAARILRLADEVRRIRTLHEQDIDAAHDRGYSLCAAENPGEQRDPIASAKAKADASRQHRFDAVFAAAMRLRQVVRDLEPMPFHPALAQLCDAIDREGLA